MNSPEEPVKRSWIRKGFKSLRSSTDHVGSFGANQAAQILVKALVDNLPLRKASDPGDALRRRKAFGGLHILGELAFSGAGEGDTKDLFDRELDASTTISGAGPGFRVLYIPNWYGFGGGGYWSSVDVNLKKESATAFKRSEFYVTGAAFLPLDLDRSEERSSKAFYAACDLGRIEYQTDELFNGDATFSGTLFRPRLGMSFTYSAFVFAADVSKEWISLTSDDGDVDWDDSFLRLSLLMGFRIAP